MSGHGDRIGYVVVEFNQASRQPDMLPFGELYDAERDAYLQAQVEREETRNVGRRETYAVAEVVLRGEPE